MPKARTAYSRHTSATGEDKLPFYSLKLFSLCSICFRNLWNKAAEESLRKAPKFTRARSVVLSVTDGKTGEEERREAEGFFGVFVVFLFLFVSEASLQVCLRDKHGRQHRKRRKVKKSEEKRRKEK